MADVLTIKKEAYNSDEYMKTLKVSHELHEAVKKLANEVNQPINKISCMIVEFALDHVKIES